MKLTPLLCAILLLTCVLSLAAKNKPRTPPAKPYTQVEDFVEQEIEGWTVLIEKALLDDHADLAEQGLRIIANQLHRMRRVVPEHVLEVMQDTKIWVQYDHPRKGAAQYHPSKDWLKENGYNVAKAQSVDIPNVKRLIHASIRQPCIMLHELSHAYHNKVMGFDDPEIKRLYEKAKASGKYEKVLNWWGRYGRHYAMKDQMEYFAESCEAYFGTNDFYPFVRVELKEFDPAMHDHLAKLFAPRRDKTDNAASSR